MGFSTSGLGFTELEDEDGSGERIPLQWAELPLKVGGWSTISTPAPTMLTVDEVGLRKAELWVAGRRK